MSCQAFINGAVYCPLFKIWMLTEGSNTAEYSNRMMVLSTGGVFMKLSFSGMTGQKPLWNEITKSQASHESKGGGSYVKSQKTSATLELLGPFQILWQAPPTDTVWVASSTEGMCLHLILCSSGQLVLPFKGLSEGKGMNWGGGGQGTCLSGHGKQSLPLWEWNKLVYKQIKTLKTIFFDSLPLTWGKEKKPIFVYSNDWPHLTSQRSGHATVILGRHGWPWAFNSCTPAEARELMQLQQATSSLLYLQRIT